MAKLDANLTITTGQGQDYLCSMSDTYSEVYQNINKVDNTDAFITLATLSKTNVSLLKGAKLIVVKNNSSIPIELQFQITEWNNSGNVDVFTEDLFITQILAGNEYMVMPNQWILAYATDTSGGMAKTISNATGYSVNSGKLYCDSATNLGAKVEDSETQVTVVDSDVFRVGDLIQLGTTTGTTVTNIEILRVVSIDSATVMQV